MVVVEGRISMAGGAEYYGRRSRSITVSKVRFFSEEGPLLPLGESCLASQWVVTDTEEDSVSEETIHLQQEI